MSLGGLGGVILAAGESSRMGRDKALLPWPNTYVNLNGETGVPARPTDTLLSAAINALSDHCDMVLVVAGKNEPNLRSIVYGCGAFLIQNPVPERGQFSSLQTGLREVLNRGRDSAMVTLVDRPPPRPETLEHLVAIFERRDHGVWAVVPEYSGTHGHPILIGREMIEAFLRAAATAKAREIEHAHQEKIEYISVDDPLVTTNIDTPEQYQSLSEQFED
jgi:molybdenum cofactor cytidylyltransferase